MGCCGSKDEGEDPRRRRRSGRTNRQPHQQSAAPNRRQRAILHNNRTSSLRGFPRPGSSEVQPLLNEDESGSEQQGSPPEDFLFSNDRYRQDGVHRQIHHTQQQQQQQQQRHAFIQRLLEDAYAAQIEAEIRASAEAQHDMMRQMKISRLPSTEFNAGIASSLQEADKTIECSICMCDYEHGEEVRFLPCLHLYHKKCIDDWLTRTFSCPVCGYDLESDFQDTQ